MSLSKYLYGLMLIALLYTDCISEFEPPSQGFEDLLVVEAFLTNNDEPFQVSLSRSTPIDTSGFIPESGAIVRLLNADGESYDLYENGPGNYLTFSIVNPLAGQEYKLRIMTSSGNMYESDFVEMRETPEIDSVSFAYEERPGAGLEGAQIFVNTHDPNNDTWYYRWEYEEDWIFYTPYYSQVIWNNGEIINQTENINQCWLSNKSTNVNIKTSTSLSQDIISEHPVLYVTNQTDRLAIKYSINVKQYSLSEASYNYWKELEKVTENLGTLFDPQPATVIGNIYNVNDESEIVLGYFDASSVTEGRLFITRSDLPRLRFPNVYGYCTDTVVSNTALVAELSVLGYNLYYNEINEFGGMDYYLANAWSCIDCTVRGTNVEPDFWK